MSERPTPHRIRRQRWRVRARSQAEAFEARRRLRDELHEQLLPAMARAFDALAPGDEVLHVPRLELRVRVPSASALSDALPELLRREVEERLAALLEGQPGEGGTREGEPGARRPPAAPRRAPAGQSRLESLSRYLETGAPPWHVEGLDHRAESVALLRPRSVAEAAAALGGGGAGAGLDEGQVARVARLLELVGEADWAALARAAAAALPGGHRGVLGDAGEAVAALAGGAAPPGSGGAISRHARLQLAAAAMAASRAGPGPEAARELAAVLAGVLGADGGRPALELVALLPEGARAFFLRALGEGAAQPEPDGAAAPAVLAAAPPSVAPPAPGRAWAEGASASDALPRSDLPPAASRAAGPAATPAPEPFGLVASCAGLSLAHPFLARFFESTGLKRPGEPGLAPSALPRAAALLYFLATGEEEAYEFELGYLKVLLGAPPEAPLSVAAGLLTERDREEAEGLLKSVVGHWRALKSTSVRGLRASFLQRRGLLSEQDQGFRLRVEPAPFDVLLGQLPWGISVVKLPWMKKPIFTEWPAC
ncbi:contractile injection system tape measure protein [Sorangium sp. So ce260]|uniref:contractile injection system tape measure protein n=1 Tax=Sorangium sp. So ce260 TaxID=3133291 RepID=UPI003F626440